MTLKVSFNLLLPRHLPLVGILIAYGASITGSMIASIVLPWFVLELTGDAAKTVLQQRSPVELRGRILSTVNGVSLLAAPLGLLMAGLLLATLGVHGAMAAISAGSTLVTIWVAFSPIFQKLEKP
jgi:hypothetical protein